MTELDDMTISAFKFIILIGFIFVVAVFVVWVLPAMLQPPLGEAPEYQVYESLRDHSNCTKEHDQECLGGCIHTYQMCLIRECGDAAVQW